MLLAIAALRRFGLKERIASEALSLMTGRNALGGTRIKQQMPEQAEDKIVRNLTEALERLHEDLDRVELWTAALGYFQSPVPEYGQADRHLLPVKSSETFKR
jgi:hypothetical protein